MKSSLRRLNFALFTHNSSLLEDPAPLLAGGAGALRAADRLPRQRVVLPLVRRRRVDDHPRVETYVPLVRADGGEREGYVPNVTYSCGAMVHGRVLVLPYAIADSFTTFATVPLDALLAEMS